MPDRTIPDPGAAGRAAIEARRARAAVKRALAAGERGPRDVAERAWQEPGGVEARLRVPEYLGSLRGMGPKRVEVLMRELAIAPSKHLGGLGGLQRERVRAWLDLVDPSRRPRLIVLAGPTAVGKGTVAQYVREHFPQIRHSVSATTRAPRPGEIDGVHYAFVSDAEFDRMVEDGEFLEWATVHNLSRYGTPRSSVQAALDEGSSVLLEIDLQGARQVRESFPDAVLLFLAPPSWDELVRRLIGRGTETPAERAKRLETAKVELASQPEFDATIVNADVAEAAREVVERILAAEAEAEARE
ncbi:guanylate kinase [Agrococcus sp. Marseille-Q4369]|uniref:guanylate kinase n=1 Tax=Agrococcus sp. Marseille-Q4369 TaxID=2810513 RepID=UPI001B8BC3D2|nr:guanylate kinase [Agrococcus sp. Marseille-Q4369]QUW20027.1 guanylate kinase [Agrococcus sp. Marseille-Q4369]